MVTTVAGGLRGKLWVNITSSTLIQFVVGADGREVSPAVVKRQGLTNLRVPVDCGSFRRLKNRAAGAATNGYAVDLVFHPHVLQFMLNSEFCRAFPQFREQVVCIGLDILERELRPRLHVSRRCSVQRGIRYVDEQPGGGSREFADLDVRKIFRQDGEVLFHAEDAAMAPADEDDSGLADLKLPTKQVAAKQVSAGEGGEGGDATKGPLIVELDEKTGKAKRFLKKGFLNIKRKAGRLYPRGSGEGVLPENAGDPLGYIPKSLRQKCNVINTGDAGFAQANAQAASQLQQQPKQKPAAAGQQDRTTPDVAFAAEIRRDLDKFVNAANGNGKFAPDDVFEDGEEFDRAAREAAANSARVRAQLHEEERVAAEHAAAQVAEEAARASAKQQDARAQMQREKCSVDYCRFDNVESDGELQDGDVSRRRQTKTVGDVREAGTRSGAQAALAAAVAKQAAAGPTASSPSATKRAEQLEHEVIEEDDGVVQIKVALPWCDSATGVGLEQGKSSLRLSAGDVQKVIQLGPLCQSSDPRAKFDKKRRVLSVRCRREQ